MNRLLKVPQEAGYGVEKRFKMLMVRTRTRGFFSAFRLVFRLLRGAFNSLFRRAGRVPPGDSAAYDAATDRWGEMRARRMSERSPMRHNGRWWEIRPGGTQFRPLQCCGQLQERITIYRKLLCTAVVASRVAVLKCCTSIRLSTDLKHGCFDISGISRKPFRMTR